MKRLIIFSLLFVSCYGIKSQNLFINGLKYFSNGEYVKADSLFSIYLKESPNSIDAHYNYGVTRLYLGDTCKFCEEMNLLPKAVKDKTVNDTYFKLCSSVDTFYFDKKYLKCTKGDQQYTEIIETFKCRDYKIVTVHDKKHKNKTIIAYTSDIMNPQKTDVVAIYRLYNDNHKLFIFALVQPSYPGGDDAKSEFIDKNPLIQQGKTLFNLSQATADVEYVIDKNGTIRDINLIRINAKIDKMDDFKKYLKLIISGLPIHSPAEYRGEKVDYLVGDIISFW